MGYLKIVRGDGQPQDVSLVPVSDEEIVNHRVIQEEDGGYSLRVSIQTRHLGELVEQFDFPHGEHVGFYVMNGSGATVDKWTWGMRYSSVQPPPPGA